MSNEYKTIHEFDFNLICEYFSNVERQVPGSPEVTVRALGFIDGLTPQSRIADLGCGTGGQTMTLAQRAPGQVTGLDLFPDFIRIFNRNARALGLSDRVKGIVGSMDDLPFGKESLDLIWSEGAIYNIGFERGLKEWRDYLKTGGYIAVSECSWFTAERPAEIHDFWMAHYPEIDTIPNKVARTPVMFPSRPLFCRKTAGRSISFFRASGYRTRFCKNMRAVEPLKNLLPVNAAKWNRTANTRNFTVMRFISGRKFK